MPARHERSGSDASGALWQALILRRLKLTIRQLKKKVTTLPVWERSICSPVGSGGRSKLRLSALASLALPLPDRHAPQQRRELRDGRARAQLIC
jgi:hypothetical protein